MDRPGDGAREIGLPQGSGVFPRDLPGLTLRGLLGAPTLLAPLREAIRVCRGGLSTALGALASRTDHPGKRMYAAVDLRAPRHTHLLIHGSRAQ